MTTTHKGLWLDDHNEGPPGYMAEVLRVGAEMPTDGIYSIEVLHDGWCELLTKKGACTCEPEVRPGKKLA